MSRDITLRTQTKRLCETKCQECDKSFIAAWIFSPGCELNMIGGAGRVGMLLQERSIEMQHTHTHTHKLSPLQDTAARAIEKAKGLCNLRNVYHDTTALLDTCRYLTTGENPYPTPRNFTLLVAI